MNCRLIAIFRLHLSACFSLIVSNHYLLMSLVMIMQVLRELDGDVDATIEYMIAEHFAVGSEDMDGNPYMDYACSGKPRTTPI